MKSKILLITLSVITGLCAYAQCTYTSNHIKHMRECAPYSEEYTTSIPTGNETTPILKLKSKETVVGWNNEKCEVTTEVYSFDMDKNILTAKCSFSKPQLEFILTKMDTINDTNNPNDKKELTDKIASYMNNPDICTVKNLLKEPD